MNSENILKAADHIEGLENHQFDMTDWQSGDPKGGCMTTACIAGWTVMALDPKIIRTDGEPIDWKGHAMFLMDLGDAEADSLFIPDLDDEILAEAGPDEAARVLRLVASDTPPLDAWCEVLGCELPSWYDETPGEGQLA